MSKSNFIRKVWRDTRYTSIALPIVGFLIVGMNLWRDFEQGKPFNSEGPILAVAFAILAGLIYLFCRAIFKFATKHAKHDERGQ